jgi:acyl-homoserine lactone acylase PvdQ
MWYLTGLAWKDWNSTEEGGDPDRYIVGGSVVGIPLFTYGRSSAYAWGPTALNPDNTDLYVEKIND